MSIICFLENSQKKIVWSQTVFHILKQKIKNLRPRKQILFNARVLKVTQTRCEIGQIASFGLKPAQDGENFKQGFIS